MIRLNSVLAAAFIVGVLAAPALAQDVLAKRVTLDLKGVEPNQAFKAVADAVGLKVDVGAGVTAPVDVLVRSVSAKTALNVICESIGCQWTFSGNVLVVKPLTSFAIGVVQHGVRGAAVDKDKASARAQVVLRAFKQKLPAGLTFENAPLDAASKRLSEALGLHVQLTCKDPGVQTLTMDFSNLTLQEALQAIAAREDWPKAAWQLTIGPLPGDTQTPSIAIMVGRKAAKKPVTKR